MTLRFHSLLAVGALAAFTACSSYQGGGDDAMTRSDGDDMRPASVTAEQDAMLAEDTIAGGLASEPDHAMMSERLRAAGLDQTLRGEGPYTVFVITNEGMGRSPSVDPEQDRRVTLVFRLLQRSTEQPIRIHNHVLLHAKAAELEQIARVIRV